MRICHGAGPHERGRINRRRRPRWAAEPYKLGRAPDGCNGRVRYPGRRPSSPWLTFVITSGRSGVMFRILSTCKGGGYRYCRTDPPHPRRNAKGLYPLHIVLVENKIGRLLTIGEEVHHIDEDKTNDDPGNLELTTKREHARHHALERAPDPIPLKCPECCEEFSLLPHDLRRRVKRNKAGVAFCSQSCATLWHMRQPGSALCINAGRLGAQVVS